MVVLKKSSEDNSNWQNLERNAAATIQNAGSKTLGATTASITLTPNPGFRSLKLIILAGSTGGSQYLRLQVNNDTGANYSYVTTYQSSGIVTPASASAQTSGIVGLCGLAGSFASNEITLPFSYSPGTRFSWIGASSLIGGPAELLCAGYAFEAPVTTITLFPDVGSFAIGTLIDMYGMP